MGKRQQSEPERTDDDIARRRDETVKRMIAMQPKTLKGAPKRVGGKKKSKAK